MDVRARVTGFLEEVLFKEGETVKAGAPLYRNDLAFGPVHPGWDTPAGIGEARRVDTTLTVGAAAPVRPSATVMPLAPDATLTLTLR